MLREAGDIQGGMAEFGRYWPILLGCTLGMFLGPTGISFYSFGVFVSPLGREFGWSLSSISLWMTWLGIGNLLMAPIAGLMADRTGVKPFLLVAIPVFAGLLCSMAFLTGDKRLYYAAALLMGAVGTFMGTIYYTRIINGWFDRGRGRALSLITAGVSFSAIVGPWITQEVVTMRGWRVGFFFLGLTAIMQLPIAWMLLSDGKGVSAAMPAPRVSFTQLVSDPVFWLVSIAVMLCSLSAGVMIHIIPHLNRMGMSRSSATVVFGLIGLFSIVGRLLSGVLVDRARSIVWAPMLLSLQAVAFVMLVILPPQLIFLSMIFIGLGFGIEADYIPYLISRAFGLRAYAAIFGAMMSFAGTLSMFGPFIYARLEEVTGNYAVAFSLAGTFALCASVMLALAAWTVRPARSASFAS